MTLRWLASAGGGGCEFFQGHRDHSPDEIASLPYVRGRGPPLGHYCGEGQAPALEIGLYHVFARRGVRDEGDDVHGVWVRAGVAMART